MLKRSPALGSFLLLGAALLVAAMIRVPRMARESLWLDETFTEWVVTQPLTDAVATVRRDGNHPPLHYLLTRAATASLGNGPVGLRIVSLISSLALVGVVFGLGRTLSRDDNWLAFGGALLVAVSDVQVYHAVNARNYALWSLLIAGAAWCWYLVVTDPGRRESRIAFAVLATLAVLTHFFAIFYFPAFGAMALATPRRMKALRDLFVLSVPAALAFAGWMAFVLTSGDKPGGQTLGWILAPNLFNVGRVGVLLFGVPLIPFGGRTALGAALLLGVTTGLLLRRRAAPLSVSREARWLVGASAVLPAGLILMVYFLTGNSYWIVRQVLPSQAFVAIAVAMMIALISRTHRVVAGLWLAGLVVLNNPGRLYGPPSLLNDPYDRVAKDLRTLRGPGELAVATGSGALWVLNYYLSGPDTLGLLHHGPYRPNLRDWTPYPYPPLPDSLLSRSTAVWVVTTNRGGKRRDSLLAAGWKVQSTRSYPPAERPELWLVDTLRLQKLVPPARSD